MRKTHMVVPENSDYDKYKNTKEEIKMNAKKLIALLLAMAL